MDVLTVHYHSLEVQVHKAVSYFEREVNGRRSPEKCKNALLMSSR